MYLYFLITCGVCKNKKSIIIARFKEKKNSPVYEFPCFVWLRTQNEQKKCRSVGLSVRVSARTFVFVFTMYPDAQ